MKGKVRVKGKEKRRKKVKVEKRKKMEVKAGILGLSGKQITIFLLEFLAFSAPILAIWYYIGEFYQVVVFFFAKLILLTMGYTPVQISAVNLSGAYLGNFNLVPLVALAIATPGWGLRKRGEMLAIGIPILFFCMSWIWWHISRCISMVQGLLSS